MSADTSQDLPTHADMYVTTMRCTTHQEFATLTVNIDTHAPVWAPYRLGSNGAERAGGSRRSLSASLRASAAPWASWARRGRPPGDLRGLCSRERRPSGARTAPRRRPQNAGARAAPERRSVFFCCVIMSDREPLPCGRIARSDRRTKERTSPSWWDLRRPPASTMQSIKTLHMIATAPWRRSGARVAPKSKRSGKRAAQTRGRWASGRADARLLPGSLLRPTLLSTLKQSPWERPERERRLDAWWKCAGGSDGHRCHCVERAPGRATKMARVPFAQTGSNRR